MSNQDTNIVCPHCSAVNRVPASRARGEGKCGGCHRSLFEGKPVSADEATFGKHLSRNDVPVLVDFWAPWCGPCRMMGPAFESAAAKLEPRVRLIKLNTQNEPEVGARHNIRSIPTMALYRGGREVARTSGAMSEAQIVQWVNAALGSVN